MKKNSIYLRILEIANVKNSSQLADKLGITPQAVSKWKKEGGIKIETLVSIAEVTGASIHWLLTGQGEKFFTKQEHSGGKRRVSLDDLLPVHGHLFSALSVVAEIGQALKLTAKKETTMVPTSIVSEISVVLRVTDDYFAVEGIQAGQLLVVEPVNGSDVSGSVVVALFDNRESVPCRGRERAPALGSEGVRAIERAAGMETGEGLLCIPPVPPPVLAAPEA